MNLLKMSLTTISALILSMSFTGCTPSNVAEGEEAVLIYQPYFIGHGGVDQKPVKTGLVWTAFSTKVVRVNLKPYNINEVFNDLVTKDNNPVDFKLHLTFQNIENKTPILVEKFGADWYKSKVREPLRNITRNFTKDHKMFEMTTNRNVAEELEKKVLEEISTFMEKEEIPVELLKVTVGKVMPPEEIVAATIQTGVQKQNVKTQTERVKAEKAREAAERASAKADKAYMDEIGMSTDQYLKSRELDNQREAIKNGSKVTIIMGGQVSPMVQVGN
jgi:regulator of protease activity HflC (stomatin/prohibitin superfamily)